MTRASMLSTIFYVLIPMGTQGALKHTAKLMIRKAEPCLFSELQRKELYGILHTAECDQNQFEQCYINCFFCGIQAENGGEDLNCKMYCAMQQDGTCEENLRTWCSEQPVDIKQRTDVDPCDAGYKASVMGLLLMVLGKELLRML